MLQSQQTLQNRYRLQKQLGNNPTRQTWIAEDIESQQQVVVKLLPFSPQTQWQDVKLFEREAQVLQHLNHPCIPRYLDYFSIEKEAGGGLPWFALVQEYIPGSSLQQLLQDGKSFTETDAKEIAKQLLEILIHLHELSPPVLHRDIKPSNLIALSSQSTVQEHREQSSPRLPVPPSPRHLTASPRPRVSASTSPGQLATSYYLVDFGAVQDRAKAEGVTFTVVGTGGYAPPEQLWGKAVAASDLYALGATLVHLLTGIAPGKLPQHRMRLQFRDKVTLSPEFAHWLDKLLDPAVEKRFGQARQAREALDAIKKEEKAEKFSFGRLGRLELVQYGVVGLCALALPLFAAYRYINEGRIAVSAMNRTQQDSLLLYKEFTDSLEHLEALRNGFTQTTQNYSYSVYKTHLYSLNYATPRTRNAKGYVGIVAIISEDRKTETFKTAVVFCETREPGKNTKKKLYITQGYFILNRSFSVSNPN
ncbi:protein kinase [Lusitaniella coriacea LEGE 07157]|uniref:Protein kinase n=1 Tax=Lusitaniella coriacea LEGE 07157 TaxID=945747 RepID=A0A8J7DZX1_9CYAN|nr:type IV pilin-like G/H family protein [Lusitaniella coriacea]MBE9118806.1 protein kinase [Lusitaniella coriacea LEGE 07157]